MKNKLKLKAVQRTAGIISVMAVIIFTMSACASMILVSVETDTVTGPAQVRQFDAIDPRDITVYGVYKDDSRKQVSISRNDITFDNTQTGPQTVSIRTSAGTVSFQTEVMALTGITIASQPTKTLFKIGESANAAWPGLEIQGTWNQLGNSRVDTASCQFTGYSSEPAGRKTITVTYGGRTATFNVEVLALASIELDKPPTKTDYTVGEALNLAGISVYGNYGTAAPNRIRELIPQDQLTASGFDSSRVVQQQRVTVTVRGQSATFTVNVVQASIKDQMVRVPGGTFQMGKNLGTGGSDITPVANVTLSGFSIGKYQVTQAQWQEVMGSLPRDLTTGNFGRGDNFPVYYVCWYDALVFCNKLSVKDGLTPAYRINNSTNPDDWGTVPTTGDAKWNAVEVVEGSNGYRLPTEAQWEYAAKGGNPAAAGWVGYTYSGSDTVGDVAWNTDNSGGISHAVGTKAPNRLGIYDMSGNVFELCWDWYGFYSDGAKTDPMGPGSSGGLMARRMMRGGGYSSTAENVSSVSRQPAMPYVKGSNVGFRVARPN